MSEPKIEKWVVGLTNIRASVESAMNNREIYFGPSKAHRDENGNLHVVIDKEIVSIYEDSNSFRVINLMAQEEIADESADFLATNYAAVTLHRALEEMKE